jgi:hypothetical protein
MPKRSLLDRIQGQPLVVALVLIGSVGGGVATLGGGLSFLLQTFFPGSGSIDDPLRVKGAMCSAFYADHCLEQNKALNARLEGAVGKYIRLDLEIEEAFVSDEREALCGEDFEVASSPYVAPQGYHAFELPTALDECDQRNHIAFPTAVAKSGVVRRDGGGWNYRISGLFLVKSEPMISVDGYSSDQASALAFSPVE